MPESEMTNLRKLRSFSDRKNGYCVFASVHELASALGVDTNIPTPREFINLARTCIGVNEQGLVAVRYFFPVVKSYIDSLGLCVQAIHSSNSVLERFEIPTCLQDRVNVVSGYYEAPRPHMVILFNDDGDDIDWHAEVDDGSRRSIRRLRLLYERGWATGMTVTIDKIKP